MTSISERVRTLLESLGDTPDEVAESLRRDGITGRPEDSCDCPIANLIRRTFPVSDIDGWTDMPDQDPGGWCVFRDEIHTADGRFPTPHPVREFIALFDGYPHPAAYQDLRADR